MNRQFLANLEPLRFFLLSILLVAMLASCQTVDERAISAPTLPATAAVEQIAGAGATWTPPALASVDLESIEPTVPPPPTSTLVPTSTVVPVTQTPAASATVTEEPTATEPPPTSTILAPTSQPQATATQGAQAVNPTSPPPTQAVQPTAAAEPVLGVNVLPNPSFEEGHYLQNGVAELQLPNKWRIEWDEGPTGIGNAAWDVYVRPEARVLSTAFLPPEEHGLYIYNGQHTVKIFKGNGAVSFRLLTDVTLEPGTYVIEAKMFADIVERWADRQKQWAQDPSAAEFRFIVGDGASFWTSQKYGQINVHNYTFTIDQPVTIPVGIALRGKYAIANNGWFIDDLSLRRVE